MTDRPPAPASLADHVAAGVLDTGLAALVWLLVEARVPVVVAGTAGRTASVLHAALVELLPADTRGVTIEGENEDFAWMPEAVELGWRRERARMPASTGAQDRAAAATTAMIVDIRDEPGATWGDRARIVIRALAVGYDMLATAGGDRLEDVLGRLAAQPVGAIDDELTRLGVVLTVADTPRGTRVTAAHYLRPVVRDAHGHVQRRAPAVLATWDEREDRFEDFAWGIADELAARVGLRPTELEREQARRAAILAEGRRTRD